MHAFNTAADAKAAGFVLAVARQVHHTHRGCWIICWDTSGPRPLGLSFGLRVEICEKFTRTYLGVRSDRVFGQSTAVKLAPARTSALGSFRNASDPGRVVQMFEPSVFEYGLSEARHWIDQWFRHNPDAQERYVLRQAQERAAQRQRA